MKARPHIEPPLAFDGRGQGEHLLPAVRGAYNPGFQYRSAGMPVPFPNFCLLWPLNGRHIQTMITRQKGFHGHHSFLSFATLIASSTIFLVSLNLPVCPAAEPVGQWVKVGGPIGGLGYNIRINPTNKNIMFVTDAYSG